MSSLVQPGKPKAGICSIDQNMGLTVFRKLFDEQKLIVTPAFQLMYTRNSGERVSLSALWKAAM